MHPYQLIYILSYILCSCLAIFSQPGRSSPSIYLYLCVHVHRHTVRHTMYRDSPHGPCHFMLTSSPCNCWYLPFFAWELSLTTKPVLTLHRQTESARELMPLSEKNLNLWVSGMVYKSHNFLILWKELV